MSARKKKKASEQKKRKPTTRRKKVEKKKLTELVDVRLMKGLAHPLRVKCLTLINNRPWSPRELSDSLDEGLSQVSYHIKVLRDFELIELCGEEPRRGAVEHYYRAVYPVIMPEGLAAQLPKSARAELMRQVFTDIDHDVAEALKEGTFDKRPDYHVSWTPMDLDDKGCKKAAARTDRYMEEMLEIQDESNERRVQSLKEGKDPEHIPTSSVVLLFGAARGSDDGKQASHRKRV